MMMEMAKKFHSETGSDRISELPEPVRVRILSFLETKNAVRTSILSSRWRGLSTWLPVLDLSRSYRSLMEDYLPDYDKDDASRVKRESIFRMREGYYAFLDRVFGSSSQLEKVKLYVPGFGLELKSRLDHWLDGAVRRCSKELELDIGARQGPRYSLPKSILSANSIMKLKLHKCELISTCVMDIRLPSLLDLCLEDVYLNEMVMRSLFDSCLNLENFIFKSCDGLRRLEISVLFKLEKVSFEQSGNEVEAIKINAPNLLDFSYCYRGDSSGDTCKIELEGCENMKHLELNGSHLDDCDLDDFLEKLPLLERLFIQNCDSLAYVEVSSQHLVNLACHDCRELVKVRVATPNLKFFTYIGEDPISVVSMGKGSALRLTDASLSLKPDFRGDQWFVGLIKLLAKLSHSETLTLEVASEKDIIIPEIIRTINRPPLFAVKHLSIEFRLSRLKSPVAVVDSLLWLAPSPESISISNCDYSVRKSIKFAYEEPLKGKKKKCGCWKSSVNCWRHSLKTVWIENDGGAKDDAKLVDFLEKARIDGKVECYINNEWSEF